MLARYLNAPLLLLLWQVAPVDIKRDEGGRVRLSLGVGGGQFAFNDYPGYPGGVDCAGNPYPASSPGTEGYSYSSRGASAEVWAKNNVRILAALGSVDDQSGERQGTFGAAQAVFEQKRFGIGLGFASLGGMVGGLEPSGSVRLGSLDRISLRADYRYPEPWMGLSGGPRIGIGFNQGRSGKARLFVGMGTTPVPDSARRVGGFLELAIPLWFMKQKAGLSVSGFLSGQYHGNKDKGIHAFGLGGWIQP